MLAGRNYIFRNKRILEYCVFNTNDQSLKRGTQYFYENKIMTGRIVSDDPLTKEFRVVGSGAIYRVLVYDFDNDRISSACTCPYDWGGICKHQVAALIHIDQSLAVQKQPVIKQENRTFAIGLNELDPELLSSRYKPKHKIVDEDFRLYQLNSIQLKEKEIKCKVSTGFYWDNTSFQLTISSYSGGLKVKCNCSEGSNQMCSHSYYALSELIKQTHFPVAIVPEQQEQFAGKILANLGLKDKVGTEGLIHFEIDNSNNIRLKLNEKYTSVISLVPEQREYLANYYFGFTNIKNPLDLPEKHVEEGNNEAKFAIGYVLISNEAPDQLQIVPIAGKLNKAGTAIISNFCYYDEACMLPVQETEADELLFRLCGKLSDEYINRYLTNRNDEFLPQQVLDELWVKFHFYFQYLPAIANQLASQAFVFHTNTPGQLATKPPLKRGFLKPVEVSESRAGLFFRVVEDDVFAILEPMLEIEGESYSVFDKELVSSSNMFVRKGKTLFLMKNEEHAIRLLLAQINKLPLKVVKEEVKVLLEDFVIPLSDRFEIKFDHLSTYSMHEIRLKPVKRKLYISGQGNFVLFKPVVEYEKNINLEVLKRGTPVSLNGHIIHKGLRDIQFEEAYENFFRELHPFFSKQFPYEFYNLKASQMLDDFWFFDAFEKLQQNEVEIYGLNELKNFRYNPNKASISTNMRSGKDWFEADVEIAFGDNIVLLKDVKKSVLKQERYIQLADGSVGILPVEWLERFKRYLRIGELQNNKIRIAKTKFPLLEEMFEHIDNVDVIRELAEKRKKLKSFEEIKKAVLPSGINGVLRDYQKEGYNWLNFLREFSWGGILADDMGLGKTIQAITLLKQVADESKQPSLVVLPTTLIFNWQNEFKKFCPSLKVLFHYGIDREKSSGHMNDFDVVVTTYGLIINDIEFLQEVSFNYLILDESQAIKNPQSKRYKAVKLLKAENRLAMTGTPIENSTFDLYAQMNFVNPGFFGSIKKFRDDYATPVDRNRDQLRAAELQRMITPFVLRRTKEQVATELPPKTEDFIYCSMEDEQRSVYDAYRNEIRLQLLNKIEEDGIEKAKIHILEGLMKLRQICDSPALLPGDDDYGNDSVKIRELSKHITQKTANHKVVIFSQFVKMLALIRKEVEDLNVDYEYLDGKSSQKQRRESVKRFQEDENCRVFLISLKAGGTGINLTAADYVYIVDPWWNPAVENQAIDRCYRIGQDKKVFAYRMICKDTIEDKISEYQQQKRAVAEDVIQTDENFMKQLSKEDVMGIFG